MIIFLPLWHICLLVNLFDKSFQLPLLGTTDFLTSDIKSIDLGMTKSVALHQSSMDLPKSKVKILLHLFSFFTFDKHFITFQAVLLSHGRRGVKMDSRSKGIGILHKLDGVLCSLQDWFLTNFSLSLSLSLLRRTK